VNSRPGSDKEIIAVENKRFQVFVSSTFKDLVEERDSVFNTITRMNYIPAGMEFFPAYNEDQLEFIKTIIDDSDYYVVITAGKYGTEDVDGLSFTEKEFLYANSIGIPILSFLHGELGAISADKTEAEQAQRTKLDNFRKALTSGRLVKFWKSKDELTLQVTQALQFVARTKQGIGWIRGNLAASSDILNEINDLRKQKEILNEELNKLRAGALPYVDNIAGLDESITLRFSCGGITSKKYDKTVTFSWGQLFLLIGPSLVAPKREMEIVECLERYLRQRNGWEDTRIRLFDEDLDTVKIQFVALGLISMEAVAIGDHGVIEERLQLLDSGTRTLIDLKAIRAP
jgi:Domain of unknown function (DUF4062)